MTTKREALTPSVSWSDLVEEELAREPEEWAPLLNACLDESPETFLAGLRHVLNAQRRGVTGVSAASGVHRVSLYKAFSKRGNPTYKTLVQVLDAVGLRLRVEWKAKPKRQRKSA